MNHRFKTDSERRNTSAENHDLEYLAYGLLAEEFEDAKRDGRVPDITRLLQAHPELKANIKAMLPMVRSLQELADAENVEAEDVNFDRHCGTLGDFRILGEIGRGGMGIVYKAEQISLRRMMALKVLPFAAVMDSKQLQRFKNEAQAAAALNHPPHCQCPFGGLRARSSLLRDGID